MKYIEKGNSGDCIFCQKPVSGSDEQNFIVKRGKLAFVIMNFYPYTTGHLMVAPYRHTGGISNLTDGESSEIMTLLAWSEQVLTRAIRPGGFNIGINIGRCAGAGYPDHVHVHVVPRWEGDANFMPVLSETKVLPETLGDTYRKIVTAKHQLEKDGQ